jgi:hypothetical protein
MQFSSLAILGLFAVSSLAAPAATPVKRAAAVLTEQTYNEFSISSGVAGKALDEVNAKFPVRPSHSGEYAQPLNPRL